MANSNVLPAAAGLVVLGALGFYWLTPSSTGPQTSSVPAVAVSAATKVAPTPQAPKVAPAPQMAAAASPVTVVATVNGRAITEADMKLAEAEIGGDLGTLPEGTKRRVLAEYLIENELFASAADGEKLAQGSAFDERLAYWKRRALRDTYFDKSIKEGVSEAEARKFYDAQVASIKPEEEVHARHILVESEDQAKDLRAKLASGSDFAMLAKEFSKDPGTKDDGGDLGFFGAGQMVPEFEQAALGLKPGELSQPIKTQFGWHVIKVDERRARKPPPFETVKDRLVASLIHKKAQEMTGKLREAAKVEFVDAGLKKMVDDEKTAKAAMPAPGGTAGSAEPPAPKP